MEKLSNLLKVCPGEFSDSIVRDCSVVIHDSGEIELAFSLRDDGQDSRSIKMFKHQVEAILVKYAETVPGASTTFAKCVVDAVKADNELLDNVANCTEFRDTNYHNPPRQWLTKLPRYRDRT